jgi:glycosyltransferase involved in cell wall biosynthesis
MSTSSGRPPDSTTPRIAVIVPAYNEERSIAAVVEAVHAHDERLVIIVINDGSSDDTEAAARGTGRATVVNLPVNLGIGGAVQTGFMYAAAHGFDIAVQIDGDGQHNPWEVDGLIEPILAGEADVVIGSRFCEQREGFKSTFVRRLGIRLFELVGSLLIRQRITDSTSGFRAYNRRAIEFLSTRYPQDYPEPEAVILLGKNGFSIKEVFVTMSERRDGLSSISGLASLYYMIKVLLAIFMVALRGREMS